MTTREYLRQIQVYQSKIDQKMELLAEMRADPVLGKDHRQKPKVKSTKDDDPMGTNAARMEELEKEIEETVADYYAKKDEIINAIHSIPDSKDMEIVYKKWVLGMKLNVIAKQMHYTLSNVKKRHWRGIKEIKKIIDKNDRTP